MADFTRRYIRMVLSALVAGVLASCTALMTALQGDGDISTRVIWIAIVAGVMAIANSLQSSMSSPPRLEEPHS